MSFSDKYPPPFDRTVDEYRAWKRDFELWQSITEAPKIKQGVLLSLRLDKVTRDEVCEAVSNADLVTEGGVKKVLDQLDKIFIRDKKLTAFEAYEHFESYERPGKLPITEYVKEFQKRLKKVENDGTKIADHILAYRLIKSAKLSENQLQILKATAEMTYEAMTSQMKKIFISDKAVTSVKEEKVKEEQLEEVSFYGRSLRRQENKGSSEDKGELGHKQRSNVKGEKRKYHKKRGKNPLDQFGNVTRCINCNSINHLIEACPDITKVERSLFLQDSDIDSEDESGTIFEINHVYPTNDNFCEDHKSLSSSQMRNSAILDSGAPMNVCGKSWLHQYISSLSDREKKLIVRGNSKNKFKFGCGTIFSALENVIIPAKIGNKEYEINTDVVKGDIPLLFGKEAMNKTEATLNCKNDTLTILGQTVSLEIARTGHYMFPLRDGPYSETEEKVSMYKRSKKPNLRNHKGQSWEFIYPPPQIWSPTKRCFGCGVLGHIYKYCGMYRKRYRQVWSKNQLSNPLKFNGFKYRREFFNGICYRCKERGHKANYCLNKVVCHICEEKGHKAKYCPNYDIICYKCSEIGHKGKLCSKQYIIR